MLAGLDSTLHDMTSEEFSLPGNPYVPQGDVDPGNILAGGFELPREEQGFEETGVQVLRRESTRRVPRVSYQPTIDDDELVERRRRILMGMLAYIPMELKEVISTEEMEYFGREDEYVKPTRFDIPNPELKANQMLFPEEIYGVGEEDQGIESVRRFRFDTMGRVLELVDERVFKQFAVALLWKHTVRILSELLGPVPKRLWRSGSDYDTGLTDEAVVRLNTQLENTTAVIEARFPSAGGREWKNWPKNFMMRPGFFPSVLRGDLGAYADLHLEAVQQGAITIDRAVQEIRRNMVAEPEEAEGYASPEEEGKEETVEAELTETPMKKLKASLLEAIRKEFPPPPPPPPPVPIEVRIVTDKGEGDAIRWAFGLALSYNMD